MKKSTIGLLLSAVALTSVAGFSVSGDKNHFLQSWLSQAKSGIDQVRTDLYLEECGSCHFPYQPGLLPAQSWEAIMASLDDHFGENAELSPDNQNSIQNFLLNNAAGRVDYALPEKMIAGQKGQPLPLRITEMHYFRHKHNELSQTMVEENPEVRSLSNCDRCHQGARRGLYDEHDVKIPGYGRWED